MKKALIFWDRDFGPALEINLCNKNIIICFCHHIPDRSIKFFGIEKYLCARCFGVLIGGFLGIIGILSNIYSSSVYYILLCLPLIIDGTLQVVSDYCSNNSKRFITGLLFGIGILSLKSSIEFILNQFF